MFDINISSLWTSCKSWFNSFCTIILPHFSKIWSLINGRCDGITDIFKALVSLIVVIVFLMIIYFVSDVFKFVIWLICSLVFILQIPFRGLKWTSRSISSFKGFLFNKKRRWFRRWYKKPSYGYKKNYVNNYSKPFYQKKTNSRIPYNQYKKVEEYVLKKHGVNSFKGGKRK